MSALLEKGLAVLWEVVLTPLHLLPPGVLIHSRQVLNWRFPAPHPKPYR
jgi:hypothetical protein